MESSSPPLPSPPSPLKSGSGWPFFDPWGNPGVVVSLWGEFWTWTIRELQPIVTIIIIRTPLAVSALWNVGMLQILCWEGAKSVIIGQTAALECCFLGCFTPQLGMYVTPTWWGIFFNMIWDGCTAWILQSWCKMGLVVIVHRREFWSCSLPPSQTDKGAFAVPPCLQRLVAYLVEYLKGFLYHPIQYCSWYVWLGWMYILARN